MLRLLHGWGLNAGVFQDLCSALAVPVQALDLPGHGHAPYEPGSLAPAACAAALAGRFPEPGVWLGWSLGAFIALELAARHPHCVSALVLVAATPRFVTGPDWPCGTPAADLQALGQRLSADYEGTLRRFLTWQAGMADRARVRALLATLMRAGGVRPEALTEGLSVLRHSDLRDHMSAVRAPTLVIHGADDPVVNPEAGRWLAQRIPHARFHEVGTGHAPFLSAEAAFVGLVRDFAHA